MRTLQLTSKPTHASTCRPSGGNELLCAPDCLSSTTKLDLGTIRKHPQVMDSDRASEISQAGDRIEPFYCLAILFPKKIKSRLLVRSEKLQFPSIGHTRGATMLEKQIDEIR